MTGTEITSIAPDGLAGQGVSYTPTGLLLDPGLDYERWEQMGHFLGQVHRASPWWVGDWILYGEAKWGEMYAQAQEELGLSYKTCANTVYVCRSLPLPRRVDDLSFSHHAEVAPLEPRLQDHYLKLAVTYWWTKSELRQAIRDDGLRVRAAQPDWTPESGIHPGADNRQPQRDVPAAGNGPLAEVVPLSAVARQAVVDDGGHRPGQEAYVTFGQYTAASRIVPAAIAVVRSGGQVGLDTLREALLAAGYEV